MTHLIKNINEASYIKKTFIIDNLKKIKDDINDKNKIKCLDKVICIMNKDKYTAIE